MPFAFSLALRELRGGLAGFRIFLICLALGVAGIAAVGSITGAIRSGLATEGREILGGDAAVSYTYRFAREDERAWLEEAGDVSAITDLRSMLSVGDDRALVQLKGVDDAYPLYGAFRVEGGLTRDEALGLKEGRYGVVVDPVLAERLDLSPGDEVGLGAGAFEYRGAIEEEPDAAGGGFALGPRVIASTEGLQDAGLLGEGTIFDTRYRLRLSPGLSLNQLRSQFEAEFPEAGARWRDRRNAAPGVDRFVRRTGAFLTLVGLAALVVGGVGVGAAVRGYLGRKVRTIAALRTLGAPAGTVFAGYLIQVALIAALGVAIGVILGGGLVAALGPLLAKTLPLPADFAVYPKALAIAALFGFLTAALFTLWPLSWLREVRPAQLFRAGSRPGGTIPRPSMLVILAALAVGAGALVVWLSGLPRLALGVILSIGAALVVLRGLGWLIARGARTLSHSTLARRRPVLRLALGAIGEPNSDTPSIVMALGLGLGVLAAIGQIDSNMQRLITEQLPKGSPAFFLVDVQPDQLDPVKETLAGIDGTERTESAAMLRGVLTHLDGVPAAEAKIDPAANWVIRGDRGISYADRPPEGAVLTEGEWWAEDYDGPPLMSFVEEEGRELGLELGDTVTINVLGRPITATIANFREVEWQGLGINFVMMTNKRALDAAPHTHIATVYATREAEGEILRALGRDFPNVTAVGVREQIARVSDALSKLGAATRWGALAVLLTGLAVLIGAAGAAAERQVYEAAILKVLGAERRRILASFALRAALLGAGAGIVALIWGLAAAWGVTRFVLDAEFHLAAGWAALIVVAGAALNLLAGLIFAARPLGLRPAGVLRIAAG